MFSGSKKLAPIPEDPYEIYFDNEPLVSDKAPEGEEESSKKEAAAPKSAMSNSALYRYQTHKPFEFKLNLTQQFCIWFEVPNDPKKGLSTDWIPDFHKLRLIKWREAQPTVQLRFIYSAEFLSVSAQQSLFDFCERLRIEPIDLKTQLSTMLEGESDHKIFALACQEHDHCPMNQGGNPAAISDLVRILRGLRGWIYTDFEYLRHTRASTYENCLVHAPFIASIYEEEQATSAANDIWAWPEPQSEAANLWQLQVMQLLHDTICKKYEESKKYYEAFSYTFVQNSIKTHPGFINLLNKKLQEGYQDIFAFRRSVLTFVSDNWRYLLLYRVHLWMRVRLDGRISFEIKENIAKALEKLKDVQVSTKEPSELLTAEEHLLLKRYLYCFLEKVRWSAVIECSEEDIDSAIKLAREELEDIIWVSLVVPFSGPHALSVGLIDVEMPETFPVAFLNYEYYPQIAREIGKARRMDDCYAEIDHGAWRTIGRELLDEKASAYTDFLKTHPFYCTTQQERDAAARTIQVAWRRHFSAQLSPEVSRSPTPEIESASRQKPEP